MSTSASTIRVGPLQAVGALAAAAAIIAVTGCQADSSQAAPEEQTPSYVTGGDCANERATVQSAEPRHESTGDVDGDGRPDSIYLADDPDAGPNCRTFVVVDTGDVTYSANLTAPAHMGYHSGGSTLTRIVDLGGSSGAEIVVKQVVTATEWMDFYPVFTLHAGGLQAVDGPANAYDPFGLPTGAGCSTDGRVVMSTASDLDPNVTRKVTRTFYELVGATWQRVGHESGEVPAGQPLAATYPEFARPFFTGC